MGIEIDRTFFRIVGFRYYARGEHSASISGNRGRFQIYAYFFLITIDMPWKHIPKMTSDISINYCFSTKQFTFRKWGINP